MFRAVHTDLDDKPGNGPCVSTGTKENVDRVDELILGERRLKIGEIAEIVGISTSPLSQSGLSTI